MEPDNHCTGWIDGWPTWLGGMGEEWLHCCVAHDYAAKTIANDIALGRCVAEVSSFMGVIMAIGALTLGTVYVAFLRASRRRKTG